jgi:hypothetical protein
MKEDEVEVNIEQSLRNYYSSVYNEMPSPSEVRDQVVARLQPRPKGVINLLTSRFKSLGRGKYRLRTAFISVCLAVLLLSGVVLIIPPARTWAQDTVSSFMNYFGFNRSTPLSPEGKIIAHPTSVGTNANNCIRAANGDNYCASGEEIYITQGQAANSLGFTVKAPSYIPNGYIDLKVFLANPKEKWATWTAESKNRQSGCESPQSIRLQQWPASVQLRGGSMPVGNAKAQDVTVSGVPGLWIEKVEGAWCKPAQGNRVMQTTSFLSWEVEGIRYMLYVDSSIKLDEAIRIAESL